ncbi:MAG: hypothetical protein A7316_03490 [Candidatus Altiarchaeales archaeon WOR_SM1_86-2]|nr:MAG: hypothetical protein A7316_03490 [Candidatus Altiarchaeales archaeon WOR_SM1_86-2]
MMSYTHITFGILFFLLFGSVLGIEADYTLIGVAAFFALLADIDHPKSAIGMLFYPVSTWISQRYDHRTITHSMKVFLPLTFAALIFTPFYGVGAAFAVIIGYLSHLVADGMTVTGCPLLYPDPRPFWFLPKQLLIKTGGWQELVMFGIFSLFVVALSGVSYFGFRSLMHMIIPSFHGSYYDYCKFCDGDGERYLCNVNAQVCDESVCGDASGIGLGLTMGNLILYRDGTYLVIRDATTNQVSVDRLNGVSISHQNMHFQRKPFTYVRQKLSGFGGYSTVSGVIEYSQEDFFCDNCNEFIIPEEVLKVDARKITINHLLVSDFRKPQLHGFVQSGHLEIKEVRVQDET